MDLKEAVLAIPIEEVISKYLTLKFRGRYSDGLCPFHADTRPSLKVNPEKKMFKCFVCGAGGDSIRFVMDYLKISFMEALEKIAADHELNVTLSQASIQRKSRVSLLNAVMSLYFEEGRESPERLEFLRTRKISWKTAEAFGIGVAPDVDIVVEYMKRNDIPSDLGLELGIIRKTADGFSDFFRNRIMFPICDERGDCVGFTGRAIFDTTAPKYLNSKESDVFLKSSLLYGLNLNKNFIKAYNSVVIVEGPMDVISLYEHSIPNAVGVLGTALTSVHVENLNRFADKIILGFDSDVAGQVATNRTNENLLKSRIVSHSISYDPATDADQYLREMENGPIELWKKIENAVPVIDQKILVELIENLDSSFDRKLSFLKKIFSLVSPLGLSLF